MSQSESEKKEGKKEVTVIVNGRPKVVPKEELTFDEIVRLAFENPPTGEPVQFTIQYTKGHNDKPKGSVLEGGSLKVKDGMEIDVTATNRS